MQFFTSALLVCVCIWGDGKGCEHELVLTSLQLLSDIQTGSHCHMTEISAPCPIAQRASYVCCQHKCRPSHSYMRTSTSKERWEDWGDQNKGKKGHVECFVTCFKCPLIVGSQVFFVAFVQTQLRSWICTRLKYLLKNFRSSICSVPICPISLTANFPKLSQLIIGPLCQEGNQAHCSH